MKISKEEVEFLKLVVMHPGSELSDKDVTYFVDDGSEYGKNVGLWKRLEDLGLVECAGSYKWRPTERLGIKTLLTVDGVVYWD